RVDPGPGGVVEGLVPTAADVVDDADLLGLCGAAAGAGVAAVIVATAAGGYDQAERHHQGAHPHNPYPTHAPAPLGFGLPPASAAGWPYLTIPGLLARPRP